MPIEKQQGADAQAGAEKKQHSQLEAVVPTKAIEQWMNEIVGAKGKFIPERLRQKMENPFVFAAVAHTLKCTFEVKYNQEMTAQAGLNSLDKLVSSENFREELLSKCWVPQLSEAMTRTSDFEYQHSYAQGSMESLAALLSNKDFRDDWIVQLWKPIFERAMESGQNIEPAYVIRAFCALAENPDFKEEWIKGFFLPALEKIEKEVTGEEGARQSALHAFAEFVGMVGFREEWIGKHWEPLVKFVGEKHLSASERSTVFDAIATVMHEKGFKEENFKALFDIIGRAEPDQASGALNVLAVFLMGGSFGPESLKKDFMPAYLHLLDAIRGHQEGALFQLLKFVGGNGFKPTDIGEYIVPQVEKILKKTDGNDGQKHWSLNAFFMLVGQDEFKAEWIKKYWEPAFKYSLKQYEWKAAAIMRAFSDLCKNSNFNPKWLDGKSNQYIVQDIANLVELILTRPIDTSIGEEDARNPQVALGEMLAYLGAKEHYKERLGALGKILQIPPFGDGKQASIAIKCFGEAMGSGKLKVEELGKFVEELREFAPETDAQAAGFVQLYFSSLVQECKTKEERLEKMHKMVSVFEERGIEHYHRFSAKMLDEIYLTATDVEHSKGRKIAFAVLTKDDHNDAFVSDVKTYEKMIDASYCIAICEADDEDEVARRYFNYGAVSNSAVSALDGRMYNLVIIGGHGTAGSIGFGQDFNEKGELDLGDMGQSKNWEKGAWGRMLAKDADICLFSCSTGKEPDAQPAAAGAQESIHNMKRMLYALAYTEGSQLRVFAPKIPTNISDILFENGRVKEVLYRDEGAGSTYSGENSN